MVSQVWLIICATAGGDNETGKHLWNVLACSNSGNIVVSLNGEDIRLMLWDTAGQEEFDCITRAYYR